MPSPLRYLSSLLFSLSLTASAQTFVEGDYQINRKKATAGFEVAELLAGSNITLTWNDAAKTATLTSPLSSTGGTSITTLGTITSGTWTATPITDTFIASAATWNAKQAPGNYLTALTGDVTATGPGSVAATIANDAVTYAKLQNVSSASRLLGRGSSGAGDVQELTIGTGLAFSGTSLVATGINPFDQDLNTTDAVEFSSLLLSAGTIESGVPNLQYTHVGAQGDTTYISVKLNDGSDDIGQTLLGFRGDGAGSGTSFVQGATATFRIEQDGGTLATVEAANISGTNTGDITLAGTPNYLTLTDQVLTRSLINLTTHVTGTLPVANGGTGATTLTANNVLLGNGTSALQVVAPSTTGNVLTSNGTTWTSAAPTGATYATDLQARQGISTTTAISPATLWSALHDSLFIADFARFVSTTNTGSGSVLTTGASPYPQTGTTANSTSRGQWITQAKSGSSAWATMDYSRPSAFGLTLTVGNSGPVSTGIFRVWIGTDTNASSIAARGYGFEIRQHRLWIITHNGTTLATQDTGTDISSTSFVLNVLRCVNDGAGNITLFLNNAQIGTALTGGPTTAGTGTLNILNLNGATAAANDIRTLAGTFTANVY